MQFNKLFRPNKQAKIQVPYSDDGTDLCDPNLQSYNQSIYEVGYYYESLIDRSVWWCTEIETDQRGKRDYRFANVVTDDQWTIREGRWTSRFFPNGVQDPNGVYPMRGISAAAARAYARTEVRARAVAELHARHPNTYRALTALRLIPRDPESNYERPELADLLKRDHLWISNASNENPKYFEDPRFRTNGLGVSFTYTVRRDDNEERSCDTWFTLNCMKRDVPCPVSGSILRSLLDTPQFIKSVMCGDIRILTEDYARALIKDKSLIELVLPHALSNTNYPWAVPYVDRSLKVEVINSDDWYGKQPAPKVKSEKITVAASEDRAIQRRAHDLGLIVCECADQEENEDQTKKKAVNVNG